MVGNTHTLQNPCIFCIEEIICIQLKRWASKSCDLPANGSWHLGHFCQIKYSILPKWHLYLYSLAAAAGSCNFHRWSDHWDNWRFSFQVDTDPCRSRNITKQVSKIKWFWKNIFISHWTLRHFSVNLNQSQPELCCSWYQLQYFRLLISPEKSQITSEQKVEKSKSILYKPCYFCQSIPVFVSDVDIYPPNKLLQNPKFVILQRP